MLDSWCDHFVNRPSVFLRKLPYEILGKATQSVPPATSKLGTKKNLENTAGKKLWYPPNCETTSFAPHKCLNRKKHCLINDKGVWDFFTGLNSKRITLYNDFRISTSLATKVDHEV